MKKQLILVFTLLLILSCDENRIDCSTVLCAGPPVFLFELISNDENVLENRTYTLETISVTGTDEASLILEIQPVQTGSGEITSLQLNNPTWEPQVYELTLKLGADFSIPLVIDMGLTEAESCCGGIPVVNAVSIDGEPQSLIGGPFFTVVLN
ncbi:hypothetical protein ACT6NV_09045 [Robiginitalea sp. IMCC44478]|uniref:hypothetical protein n=1 Tax=Robiginitalea sp. IMCC44478 TaxID=3459122 RepID=UPI004042FF50